MLGYVFLHYTKLSFKKTEERYYFSHPNILGPLLEFVNLQTLNIEKTWSQMIF